MPPPRIVALCGGRRCGKDTVAGFLATHGYLNLKISQKLKDACGVLFGFTAEQLEGDAKDAVDPRWGVTPRALMQFLGTEVMQQQVQAVLPRVGRAFWIDAVVDRILAADPAQRFVVSDVRFVHEAVRLRGLGALVVRVARDPPRGGEGAVDQHASEREHLHIRADLVLHNNATLRDLFDGVEAAIDLRGEPPSRSRTDAC